MSNNFSRKLVREQEKQYLMGIKKMYGKKAKFKCPKCKRKSLFYTNEKGEAYCVRCDDMVALKNEKGE